MRAARQNGTSALIDGTERVRAGSPLGCVPYYFSERSSNARLRMLRRGRREG